MYTDHRDYNLSLSVVNISDRIYGILRNYVELNNTNFLQEYKKRTVWTLCKNWHRLFLSFKKVNFSLSKWDYKSRRICKPMVSSVFSHASFLLMTERVLTCSIFFRVSIICSSRTTCVYKRWLILNFLHKYEIFMDFWKVLNF